MKDLLVVLASSLVSHPEDVNVTENIDGTFVNYELRVNPEDMGKVIGKHGRIAKSIRTVMKACANKAGKKVNVDIVGG